ncbi:PH domain-like [Phytophthora cactorum]|nr:PH domain-like [Phytophthora cactorum]
MESAAKPPSPPRKSASSPAKTSGKTLTLAEAISQQKNKAPNQIQIQSLLTRTPMFRNRRARCRPCSFPRSPWLSRLPPLAGLHLTDPSRLSDMTERMKPKLKVSESGRFEDQFYHAHDGSKAMARLRKRAYQKNRTVHMSGNDVEQFSDADIITSGYLVKQGSFWKSWRRRFFILRRDRPVLCYYTSAEELAKLGEITIDENTRVQPSPKDGFPFRFTIENEGRKLTLFAEQGEESMEAWMSCINGCITQRVRSTSRATMNGSFDRRTEGGSFRTELQARISESTPMLDDLNVDRASFSRMESPHIASGMNAMKRFSTDSTVIQQAANDSRSVRENEEKQKQKMQQSRQQQNSRLDSAASARLDVAKTKPRLYRSSSAGSILTQSASFTVAPRAYDDNGLSTMHSPSHSASDIQVTQIPSNSPRAPSLSLPGFKPRPSVELAVSIGSKAVQDVPQMLVVLFNIRQGQRPEEISRTEIRSSLSLRSCGGDFYARDFNALLSVPRSARSMLQLEVFSVVNPSSESLENQKSLGFVRISALDVLFSRESSMLLECHRTDASKQLYYIILDRFLPPSHSINVSHAYTYAKHHFLVDTQAMEKRKSGDLMSSSTMSLRGGLSYSEMLRGQMNSSTASHVLVSEELSASYVSVSMTVAYLKYLQRRNVNRIEDARTVINDMRLHIHANSGPNSSNTRVQEVEDRKRDVELEMAHYMRLHASYQDNLKRLFTQHESLLSTVGAEKGMLEDMSEGVRWLNSVVSFQLVQSAEANPHMEMSKCVSVTSTPTGDHVVVAFAVPPKVFAKLPDVMQQGHAIKLHGVMFTQGINEMQSVANHYLNSSLQDELNFESVQMLQRYFRVYQTQVSASAAGGDDKKREADLAELSELQAEIEALTGRLNIRTENVQKKYVNILIASSDICRRLGAGRTTCCKSGKDRTAMSVTLETSRLLVEHFHVKQGVHLCNAMRERGVRRVNVLANTGKTKFAFNSFQLNSISGRSKTMARASPSAATASASELTPLLPRDVRVTVASSPSTSSPPFRLPRWFVFAMILSVFCTLTWLALLVLGPQLDLHVDATAYLYAGVLNSLLGSFLSASGYCCQKYAHIRVARNSSLGATMQSAFLVGLFLLAVGTISAVINLGILGQAVQAPFAALTLIYSALLGRFVLHESFSAYDLISSALITLGVGVDVYAAQLANVAHRSYTLKSLGRLLMRDSVFPLGYTVMALTYAMLLLRRVHTDKLQRHPIGLLAFSSCAGVMAGFTSLATKSVVEVTKSALNHQDWLVFLNPFFILMVLAIPCALVPQLFFLNKGLEFFGTLKFIPLYQAFIIIGNMGCGMIFYNEMASYSYNAVMYFLGGIMITICGVCVLLVKVDSESSSGDTRRSNAVKAVDRPMDELLDQKSKDKKRFETDFKFEQMKWANDSDASKPNELRVCRDFVECQETIVELLVSARKSIYYSTFLCDFTQVLHTNTNEEHMDNTFVSLVRDAVERGVDVHILYNPVRDYGTNSIADLRRILPPQVHFACSVSDLGPSWFTRYLSNNSRYAFHHQKYLCIDEETIMVTGCDVNTEREGWLRKNRLGYYWHELSVVCRCTSDMVSWIKANHQPAVNKRHYDQFLESPPFPLVSGGWREENCMVNMIMNAKHSVQLESQIMISGGSLQHNRICPAIVARISQARRNREPFHALILTNAAQKDEPSYLARTYCMLSIQWSLEQLEDCASAYGLTSEELWQHLQVGRLEHDGVLVKVHSNILIVDGKYALRSSSNLADRSLSARPNDTELGLLFSGPRVNELQQDLLNMYLGTTGETYTWDQVFECIRGTATQEPTGVIKHLEKKSWSPVFTWFMMNVFIYLSEGATGGRVKVTYETSVIGQDKHEFET